MRAHERLLAQLRRPLDDARRDEADLAKARRRPASPTPVLRGRGPRGRGGARGRAKPSLPSRPANLRRLRRNRVRGGGGEVRADVVRDLGLYVEDAPEDEETPPRAGGAARRTLRKETAEELRKGFRKAFLGERGNAEERRGEDTTEALSWGKRTPLVHLRTWGKRPRTRRRPAPETGATRRPRGHAEGS